MMTRAEGGISLNCSRPDGENRLPPHPMSIGRHRDTLDVSPRKVGIFGERGAWGRIATPVGDVAYRGRELSHKDGSAEPAAFVVSNR